MPATLGDIERAMIAQLSNGLKPAGPFSLVGRWVGTLPSPDQVSSETVGKIPAALVWIESESAADDLETITGDAETVATAAPSVILAHADPRGANALAAGASNQPGLSDLIDGVLSGINGLRVASPAATVRFVISGTANATVTVPAGAQIIVGTLIYRVANATTVTLDGAGIGTVFAKCTSPNTLGNLLPNTGGQWNGPPPTGLFTPVTVQTVVTEGRDGLLRGQRIRYRGMRVLRSANSALALAILRFAAPRAVPSAADTDQTVTLEQITGNVNLQGQSGTAPNPIAVLRSLTNS